MITAQDEEKFKILGRKRQNDAYFIIYVDEEKGWRKIRNYFTANNSIKFRDDSIQLNERNVLLPT